MTGKVLRADFNIQFLYSKLQRNLRHVEVIVMGIKGRNARNYILNDFGNMNKNFADLKESLSINQLLDFFQLLKDNRNYQNIFKKKTEDGYNSLIKKEYFPVIYLSRTCSEANLNNYNAFELKFLTAIICYNKEIVNDFINLRYKFENAFMSSSFPDAEKYLDEIETLYGYSFWGVEARLALYFVGEMKQSAYEYCKKITYNCDEYIRYHLEILRDKVSLDINQSLFEERFNNKIKLMDKLTEYESHIRNCLQTYTYYSCFIEKNFTSAILRDLLVSSSVLSTIDKYILLEKMLTSISTEITEKYDNKFLKSLNECLDILTQNISSVLWNNISHLLGNSNTIQVNSSKKCVHKALSLFCKKKYADCWDYCKEQLVYEPNNFPLINLMAKIDSFDKPKTQYEVLINFINLLYKKEPNDKRFFEVASVCDTYERFYSVFTFGNELIAIIENEFVCNPQASKQKYIASLVRYNFTPSKLAFFIPKENQRIFIEEYKKELTDLYLCDWQLVTYDNVAKESIIDEFVCDEISHKLLTASDELQTDTTNEVGKYSFLIDSFKTKLLFKNYVDNCLYNKAIDTYIESYFLNKWLVLKIDYKYLNNLITKNIEQSLGSSIEYCVYCMLTKFNLQDAETISESVVSSYKRIMKKNKADYPSNLSWPQNELCRKCHAFFLRFICNEYVLHRCDPPFGLQQDIDEERKNILNSLINYYEDCHDVESVSVLKEEVRALSESTQTLDIINLLDEAKVDLNWILFNGTTDDAIVLAYKRCFPDTVDSCSPSITEKERYHEFLAGLASCKKNYVNEVNRILSLCIRHGVLEDQLILFFNRHGIIKNTTKHNDAFLNNVYNLINSVIEKHIIASGENGSHDNISLYIPEEIAYSEYEKLPLGLNSPEALKSYYFTILTNQLEAELNRIGIIVFNALYYPLEKLLTEHIENASNTDIGNYVICKDLLENEVLIIRQWFKVIEYKETTYNINMFLNVFKTKYPKVKIKSNVNTNYTIKSNIIGCLYNIIFNLLNNASKHSGFYEYSDELGLNISVSNETDGKLTFVVSNNVSCALDENIIIDDINKIHSLIKNKEEIETYTPMEGKSGYQKIIRILERNFKNLWELSVFFDNNKNNRSFNVKLSICLE